MFNLTMPSKLMLRTSLIIALTTLLVNLTEQSFAVPVKAKSADPFVDSIGVNTHLDYTGTPYARFDDIVKPKLQELGIRHIRDGVHLHEELLDKLQELSQLGIKSNLVFGNDFDTVVAIALAASGSIEAVEGPNETDLEGSNFGVAQTRDVLCR